MEKGLVDFLKKSSKDWARFATISYLQNSEEVVSFHPGILFGILRIPPFVNDKGKEVNSDWLADQWDE